MSSRSRLGVLAVLVGAVAAVAVVGLATRGEAAPERSAGEVRADFLRRWEAWRRAPLTFTERTERRSGDQHLADEVDIAQRFPDRLVHEGDQVSAHLDGKSIGCSVDDGTPECVDNGSYDAEAQLADELADIRRLTSGSTATYRLTDRGDGCYRLRHTVEEFRPRWGDRYDVCFDGTAVTRETTVTGDLTITVRRTVHAGVPADTDFDLPATPVPSPAGG